MSAQDYATAAVATPYKQRQPSEKAASELRQTLTSLEIVRESLHCVGLRISEALDRIHGGRPSAVPETRPIQTQSLVLISGINSEIEALKREVGVLANLAERLDSIG